MAVALLHPMPLLKLSTLAEVWMKACRRETRRTVPLHKIHARKPELCKVLLAIYNLTGEDTTSKVGTNKGGLKAPTELLVDLDKSDDNTKAEEYLVKVLNKSSPCTTFDEYRQDVNHQRALGITNLPPTSIGIVAHIMRARYTTKLVSNSLSHIYSRPLTLGPLEYGFYLAEGEVLMLTQGRNRIDF